MLMRIDLARRHRGSSFQWKLGIFRRGARSSTAIGEGRQPCRSCPEGEGSPAKPIRAVFHSFHEAFHTITKPFEPKMAA